MQRVGYDLVYFTKFEFVSRQGNDTSAALKLCKAQDRHQRRQQQQQQYHRDKNNQHSSSKSSLFLSEVMHSGNAEVLSIKFFTSIR
jgi:hypothetical protein